MSFKHLNDKQTRLLADWQKLILTFLSREWRPFLLWSSLGAIAASCERLLVTDRHFEDYIRSTYLPPQNRFDDISSYRPYEYAVVIALTMLIAGTLLPMVRRGLVSWYLGCTSGMRLFGCVSMFVVLLLPWHESLAGRLLAFLWSNLVFFIASAVLFIMGRIRSEAFISEQTLLVDSATRKTTGTELPETDEPIASWSEDALGRAAIVDILSAKTIISKTPVIAVSGPFGSGKTSVLNLLREHLKDKAIIITFSTWLPGSQETLASYLLADIARECQKQYVVPGLGKSSRRIAHAFAKTVPFLKDYVELLPAPTQRDDISELKAALSRIPKRVVVLLDELDRMEKDELLTLLKVLKGISYLPNLTFICAVDTNEIVRIVKGESNSVNRQYFEKFFPVTVSIPEMDSEMLRSVGVKRVAIALERRDWFDGDADREQFESDFTKAWKEVIAPFCGNLRSIGLIANDVAIAAATLRREVDPIDLAIMEVLRRFRLFVYVLIAKNAITLTGGESVFRGGDFISDAREEREKQNFQKELAEISETPEDLENTKQVLKYLFPRYSKLEKDNWFLSNRIKRLKEDDKRIANASIFPAYFRYELPEAIFSSVEMASFIQAFVKAETAETKDSVFREILDSMPKGSLKRDDFLRKLSELVKSLQPEQASALSKAVIRTADQYTYDPLSSVFAEAGHALRILIRAAEVLPMQDRQDLLTGSIREATDDTMAFRVLTASTNTKGDVQLGITFSELYPSFIERMRKQYGPTVDAATVNLETSDPRAFNLWGALTLDGISIDPEERKIQRDFWLRRIGTSRKQLAYVFDHFIMPKDYMYNEDPTNFIETKLPVEDLRRLIQVLPEDEEPSSDQERSLNRLSKFLNGDFSRGIPIDGDGHATS
jgi:KAP family P-loop domain